MKSPRGERNLESPILHPLTKPAFQAYCLAIQSNLTVKAEEWTMPGSIEASEPIAAHGWGIHKASRFIEYSNSSDNVSEIFFLFQFYDAGEGEGRKRRKLLQLCFSWAHYFSLFFFGNWEILCRVSPCFRWTFLVKATNSIWFFKSPMN